MKKLTLGQKAGFFLGGLQFLVAAVFLVQLMMMGILPFKWWAGLAGILGLDLILVLVLQLGKNGLHLVGKVVSLVTILCLVCGIYLVGSANSMVEKMIANNTVETEEIYVVVKKDSDYQNLEDVKDKKWGVQYKTDVELMGKTVDAVREELKTELDLTAYDDYDVLYPDLMDEKIDAMILSGAYMSLIDELCAETGDYVFSDEIRILETYRFEAEESTAVGRNVKKNFKITRDPFTVFISGIDTYGAITTKSRSDVNILMTVNPKEHQILLVTTPRDAYTTLPGISGDSKDKLTHAGIYGVQCSIATIESIYDIPVNFYTRVNFTSVIDIVNALGGVDVYSAYDFDAFGNHYSKGMNYMDGEQALAFSRERHSFGEGDFQRGRDQMEVIKGIVRKASTSAILTGFGDILEAVSDKVQTSVGTKDLYALVRMQLEDPTGWEVFSYETKADVGREYCYSYTGKSLSVSKLVSSSVEHAGDLMKKMAKGKKIKEKDVTD